jgi:hypothetical protein
MDLPALKSPANMCGLPGQDWEEADVESYEAVLAKIYAVHGRKRPAMVANDNQLEEAVDRIPVNQYTSRRAELDAFFKQLTPSRVKPPQPAAVAAIIPVLPSCDDDASATVTTNVLPHSGGGSTVAQAGVTAESLDLLPGASCSLLCQLDGPPPLGGGGAVSLADGRFVHVSRHPSNLICDVRCGLGRVLLHEGATWLVRTVVFNAGRLPVHVPKHYELALIRWKK